MVSSLPVASKLTGVPLQLHPAVDECADPDFERMRWALWKPDLTARPLAQRRGDCQRNAILFAPFVLCFLHQFYSSDISLNQRASKNIWLVFFMWTSYTPVLCSGISLCAWHSTGVSCRQPVADIRVCRPLPSSLCRHDYAAGAANSPGNSWRPRLSGGSGAGVEQSASTDQGRLVAVVFSAADKGPSVSAVVQLTSDYCTIVF